MCKEIDKIRNIIETHQIGLSWLARELGPCWSKQRINYILKCGKEISTTAYRQIMTVLDRHGYQETDFDPEHLGMMEEVALINQESSRLVTMAVDSMSDKNLTREEKRELRVKIKTIEKRLEELKEQLQ